MNTKQHLKKLILVSLNTGLIRQQIAPVITNYAESATETTESLADAKTKYLEVFH